MTRARTHSLIFLVAAAIACLGGLFLYLRDRGDLIFIDPPSDLYSPRLMGSLDPASANVEHYSFTVRYKGDYPVYLRIQNPPQEWLDDHGYPVLIRDAPEMLLTTVVAGEEPVEKQMRKQDWHVSSDGSDMVWLGGFKTTSKNQKVDVYIKTSTNDVFLKKHGKMTVWYQFYWG